MIHSKLTLEFESEDLAEALVRALAPEFTSEPHPKASIRREGNMMVIEIEAPAIASLRALLNSYIRWVSTSLDIVKLKGE